MNGFKLTRSKNAGIIIHFPTLFDLETILHLFLLNHENYSTNPTVYLKFISCKVLLSPSA